MSKARILLVEDSELQARSALKFLEKDGYEVQWAKDGKAAITLIKTHPIDIVLLDLVLPDMTGNQLCHWLRQNEDTKGIPIIMLTVKSEVKDKVASLEAGADDYLPKPYNEIELNARIYACLRTKALQDGLRQNNVMLENLLKKVAVLASTDYLTGLYNRRQFEKVIKKEYLRAVRYNEPLTCFMLDLDNFKMINDSFGHSAGDTVLKEVSQVITACLREIDHIARWGGEEFIVALPKTDREGALTPASRILKAVSEYHVSILPYEERITFSIGIATIPEPSITTFEQLIHKADEALYRAKKNGRNRFEIHQTAQNLMDCRQQDPLSTTS